jgi:hypothetical protein
MRSIISWLLDRGCFGGWVEMGYFEVEEGLVCEAAGWGSIFIAIWFWISLVFNLIILLNGFT